MRLPTASSVALARQCAFWLSPHAPEPPPGDDDSSYSMLGDGVHLIYERIGTYCPFTTIGIYEPALDYREVLEESVASLPQGERYFELAMAWDLETRTARLLPSHGQRDYSDAFETEITGTADVVVVCDDYVFVRDVKSGVKARRKRAASTDQLRMLALAAARIFGKERAIIELDHVTPDARRSDPAELDCFALADVEEDLDKLYQTVKAAQQAPSPGIHCFDGFCPIRSNCPAQRATLAVIRREALNELPRVAAIETDEQARRVRIGLRMIRESLKPWDQELIRYVLNVGPVHMGDGVYYGQREYQEDVLEIDHAAKDVLIKHLGEDVVRDAVELSTSKTALTKAARLHQAKRGEGVKKCEDAFAELRESGAMGKRTKKKIEEYKDKTEIVVEGFDTEEENAA